MSVPTLEEMQRKVGNIDDQDCTSGIIKGSYVFTTYRYIYIWLYYNSAKIITKVCSCFAVDRTHKFIESEKT